MDPNNSKWIESLALRPLFVGMNDSQIREILAAGQIRQLEPAEIILSQGQCGQALYVILSGSVSIHVTDPENGRQTQLALLSGDDSMQAQYEGDFFGEMSVLDFEPISATVTAQERCELLIIPVTQLFEVFRRDRDTHIILIINLARTLSRRLRKANKHDLAPVGDTVETRA